MYRKTSFFLSVNGTAKTMAVGVAPALIIYFKITGRYIHPDCSRNTIHSVQMNVDMGGLTSRRSRKIPLDLILIPHSS